MKKATLFKVASQSILKNKMRTLLTMLGIVIGVGAVIVMVALGNGARSRIESQIKSLGTNVIIIFPFATQAAGVSQGQGTFSRLTIDDYDKLKKEGTTLTGVSPVIQTRSQIIGGSGNWRAQINGVSTDFFTIRDWHTTSGEIFTETDTRTQRKVAVIGQTVANALFAGGDPVGAQIQIGRVPFTIVAVLAAKGQNANGNDQDDVVLVPYATAQTRLSGQVRIGQIIAGTQSTADIPAAQEEIKTLLRETHKLNGADDDFTVRNQTEIAEAATSTTKVMSALLAAIASISLIVGGIGIMNIMLVSVTERTREIGIRMAIGARGSDVLTQFLIESIVMSVLGGLVGLGVGYGGAALLGKMTGWTVATPLSAVFIAVGFSAAVGVFFGFYPAKRAAALNPIEALRHE
jgi:putative ABC transport system permease protein